MVLRSGSWYGIGLRFCGIEPEADFHVVVTQWLTVLFVPLIPLRRARCLYLGGDEAYNAANESYLLVVVEQLPLSISSIISTYLWSIAGLVIALGPITHMILGARAPNPINAAIALCCAVWPIVVVWFIERRQKQLLEAALTPERVDAIEEQTHSQKEMRLQKWRESHVLPESVYLYTLVGGGFLGTAIPIVFGANIRNLRVKVSALMFAGVTLAVVWGIDLFLVKRRQRNDDRESEKA